ncbi:TonB-dependent receptor [Lutimonas halocynthiae]|uniref:TonB-dependent receptor n=1 Tax=Lutimonas halocynthiae TaxID=1446477 RepID=UPI0025B3CBD3|nr:TonB-dependent receptor [Lutimonas halocynthiae]MDN3641505.1 TonB-dependent receptor [Lutimonas halocynthiae]
MNIKPLFGLVIYFLIGLTVRGQIKIKGRFVDHASSNYLEHVSIQIENESEIQFTDREGYFEMNTLLEKKAVLVCKLEEYETLRIPLQLSIYQDNVDLGFISLISLKKTVSNKAWFELSQEEVEGGSNEIDNISVLLTAGKDVFSRAAAYDFGSNFFRPRFLGSEHGIVMLNGVALNKITSGRPEWSNWGGLNDALRKQEQFAEMHATNYGLGGMAKSINMNSEASRQNKSIKFSMAVANKNYQSRMMLTYATGLLKNGWAFMFSGSFRKADEGFRRGTNYDAKSLLVSIDKEFGTRHRLNSSLIYADNLRGKSSPMTQEVFELKSNVYNSYWGYQLDAKRNSREKRILEPIFQLNHDFRLNERLRIQSHLTYQFGQSSASRMDYGGHSLSYNSEFLTGGGSNPDPSYYQKLPSYFLRDSSNPNYTKAYLAEKEFKNNGQIKWEELYEANLNQPEGKNAIYALYDDRQDSEYLSLKTNFSFDFKSNFLFEGSLYTSRFSFENYAFMKDLMGGAGYLDIDSFADDLNEAQNDLKNPNRIVEEKEKFRYHYTLQAKESRIFLKTSHSSKKSNVFLGVELALTDYQRNGIYENGANPGSASLGKSSPLSFITSGVKAGFSYRFTGRHILLINANYLENAPTIKNAFSNVRVSNDLVKDLKSNALYGIDLKYMWRHPVIQATLSGYLLKLTGLTNISFYYADGLTGLENQESSAYVQEILTGIDKQNVGLEFAIEARILANVKLRGIAAIGNSIYASDPELYLTSNSIEGALDLGKSFLKGYYASGGPQKAFSFGFEYSSPKYWWLSSSFNFFDKSFISIAPIARTRNFFLDSDGLPINGIDPEITKGLLKQESLKHYMTLNLVGGKSWKIKNWYVGFFASLNNLMNSVYKTGGYEQSRNANYRTLLEDKNREKPLFGPKYWFSYGTTFFTSMYIRI